VPFDHNSNAILNLAQTSNINKLNLKITKETKSFFSNSVEEVGVSFDLGDMKLIETVKGKTELLPLKMNERINKWYYLDNDKMWQTFEPFFDDALLAAKKSNKTSFIISRPNLLGKPTLYTIDTVKFEEINHDNKSVRKITNDQQLWKTKVWNTTIYGAKSYSKSERLKDYLTLNTLKLDSDEFKRVSDYFCLSMPHAKVTKVQKINNTHLRKQWIEELFCVRKFNNNEKLQYVRLLFHGTSRTKPSVIYESSEGWQIQYANNAGKWGAGCYFAEDSKYSGRKYSYKVNRVTYQMFLAEVIVGEPFFSPKPTKYKLPPQRQWQSSTFPNLNYDSVQAVDHGTNIFIVYDNKRAYPTYLITYTQK